MENVAISAAARTAIGKLAGIAAAHFDAIVFMNLLQRSGVKPAQGNGVIMVQRLIGGSGQNPRRPLVDGGTISLRHPIGASGARIPLTLLHELPHSDSNKGLATLCIGGGPGDALTVET